MGVHSGAEVGVGLWTCKNVEKGAQLCQCFAGAGLELDAE